MWDDVDANKTVQSHSYNNRWAVGKVRFTEDTGAVFTIPKRARPVKRTQITYLKVAEFTYNGLEFRT